MITKIHCGHKLPRDYFPILTLMEDQDGNIMINNKCLQFDTELKTNTQNNLGVIGVSAKGNKIDSSSKMLI